MIVANPVLNRITAPATAKVRGVPIRAAYLFLRERHGERAVSAAVSALSPADRLLMPTVLLDSNWYPHETWRAIRRISRTLEPGAGPSLSVEMGRHMAEYCFKGVYSSFLAQDPAKQVEQFRWIHGYFYRNACTIDVNLLDNFSATVSYHYLSDLAVTSATCLVMIGFWTKTLELSGALDVAAFHPTCVNNGQDHCEYSFHWE